MSFSLYATGSPEAIKEECNKTSQHESPHCTLVKELVKGAMEGLPSNCIVALESNGHHDYSSNAHYGPNATIDFRLRITRLLPQDMPMVGINEAK